mmetsp:Transcript_13038/g.26602  ORF Transcript_13038/g.26602 Transcript_13038/m.26602 type:complete len:208 (-) Transcript_13038:99-722(-)
MSISPEPSLSMSLNHARACSSPSFKIGAPSKTSSMSSVPLPSTSMDRNFRIAPRCCRTLKASFPFCSSADIISRSCAFANSANSAAPVLSAVLASCLRLLDSVDCPRRPMSSALVAVARSWYTARNSSMSTSPLPSASSSSNRELAWSSVRSRIFAPANTSSRSSVPLPSASIDRNLRMALACCLALYSSFALLSSAEDCACPCCFA